ncbi:hypothetical protein EON65_46440 [archaeon]|nr:MAG: hypothetical protein EON65_46440 [archaeon]
MSVLSSPIVVVVLVAVAFVAIVFHKKVLTVLHHLADSAHHLADSYNAVYREEEGQEEEGTDGSAGGNEKEGKKEK